MNNLAQVWKVSETQERVIWLDIPMGPIHKNRNFGLRSPVRAEPYLLGFVIRTHRSTHLYDQIIIWKTFFSEIRTVVRVLQIHSP